MPICCCFWTNLSIGMALIFPFLPIAVFWLVGLWKKIMHKENDV
jgi:hypothetical protein